jgi:hypothetical protein
MGLVSPLADIIEAADPEKRAALGGRLTPFEWHCGRRGQRPLMSALSISGLSVRQCRCWTTY